MIYLDNAATTYPKPESVYKALDNANRNLAFNAGRGSYPEAKAVSDLISETRQQLADLVGVSGNTVSFESSATEALNIIINGLDLNPGDNVYISPFEHNAVVRPLHNLKREKGINIRILPFKKDTWEIDEEKMSNMFALNKPKACFLSHISNVTGYILPYGVIFAKAKEYMAVNVLDCSQSLGVLNPKTDSTDFIVFAGHKSLYASFGIAGFMNLTNQKLKVTKSGGTGSDSLNENMPESGYGRYEAGSLNSVAVAGLHESLKWLKETNVYEHEKELTDYMISKLRQLDNVHLFLPVKTDQIFGIVSLSVEGYSSSDAGTILAEDFNINVRTGYHCAPYVHDFIQSKDTAGTVRISIGAFTSQLDIENLIDGLTSM